MSAEYFWKLKQGTPEWLQVRCGILTASNTKQILTPKFKIADNKDVRALAYELAAQRITGRVDPQVSSHHTERGHMEEPIAIENYEKKTGLTAKKCGFIRNKRFGYSPDGVVGENGLIEVKSRVQKNQVKVIIEDTTPAEHMIQCQDGLLVSEREWIDYIQYSNGMELFVQRVYRDDELIKTIQTAKLEFEEKIVELVELYKENAKKYMKTEYIEQSQQPVESFDI